MATIAIYSSRSSVYVVGRIDFLPAINVPSEINGRNNQLFGVQLKVGRKVKFKVSVWT